MTETVDAIMAKLTEQMTPARRRGLAILVQQAEDAESGKRCVHISVATRRSPQSVGYSVNSRVAHWLANNQLAEYLDYGFYVRLLPYGWELHNRLEDK